MLRECNNYAFLAVLAPVFKFPAWLLVLFDYWIFHNRLSKRISQEVSIDDRL